MTGDELFDRMQNKEFGVILESIDDARELQSILKSADRDIENVDDIPSWVEDHNAKWLLRLGMSGGSCMLSTLIFVAGRRTTTTRFLSRRSWAII